MLCCSLFLGVKLVVFWIVTPADTGRVIFVVAPNLPVNFFKPANQAESLTISSKFCVCGIATGQPLGAIQHDPECSLASLALHPQQVLGALCQEMI